MFRFTSAAALLCTCSLATSLFGQESRPASKPTAQAQLAAMTWLAGNWQGQDSGDNTWVVNYGKPDGGLLLGTSKCLRKGKVRSFEFEQFLVVGGNLVVTPHPNGRRSVSFKLQKFDEDKRLARFDNLDHDFPQRLEYWRKDDATLVISVLGQGKDRKNAWRGFQVILKLQKPPKQRRKKSR